MMEQLEQAEPRSDMMRKRQKLSEHMLRQREQLESMMNTTMKTAVREN